MYPVSGSNYIVENRNLSQGEADHANIMLFGSGKGLKASLMHFHVYVW